MNIEKDILDDIEGLDLTEKEKQELIKQIMVNPECEEVRKYAKEKMIESRMREIEEDFKTEVAHDIKSNF